MNMTVEQILAQTKAMIQTKQAEFKKRGNEATSNPPESIGEMKPVDEGAKAMTAKQRQEEEDRNIKEKSNNTSGAKHPDTGREQAMDATEPVLTPEKKPEQSDDANAKKASAALANDLMAAIRSYQQVSKQAAAPAAAPAKVAEGKEKGEKNEKGEKKEAKADELELTRDVLAKLAALMVASDEGRALANAVMAKEAGAEAAKELMDFVAVKQAEAEYAQGQADAQRAIQQAIFAAGQQDAIAKMAAQQQATPAPASLTAEDMEYIKLGQAIADQGVADLQAAMGGGDPAAMGAVPAEAPAAGGEGEISMEDLAAAIDQLVASGVIQPEEAQQIMEYLASGGGEAAPAEAAPAEGGEAGEEEEGGENENAGEEKEGSARAKRIMKLANALAVNIGIAKATAAQNTPKQ